MDVIESYNDLENMDTIFEMAGRLPGRSQTKKEMKNGREHGLIIAIGNNESHNVHFHFFRSEQDMKKWNGVGGCIMMQQPTYYKHSGHDDDLEEDEMKTLIKFLKSPYRNTGMSMWQQLVNLWNDNNNRYVIPDDTTMPSYHYGMPNSGSTNN